MELLSSTQSLPDVQSPTRITDFFNIKKSKSRGKKKTVKVKEALVSKSSSIYLTPESSPSSDIGAESAADLDDNIAGKSVASDLSSCCSSDNVKKETCLKTSQEGPQPSASGVVSLENNNGHHSSASRSTKVTSQPSQFSSTTKDSDACHQPPKTPSKDRSATTKTIPDDATASSPSIPRPKLRKSEKSKLAGEAANDSIRESIKPKPGRRKKKEPEPSQKSVITDFFPIRRSSRLTKSEIEKEKRHQLEQQILSKCEDGLQITEFENKGRGVVATKDFNKGDFVVEYAGDLVDILTARERERKYATNPLVGCYMYFFHVGGKHYCVDATAESGRLGRLINHSREGNCCTKALLIRDQPHLVLVAGRDIKSGEELTYDYGDRSKEALEAHPWLKS